MGFFFRRRKKSYRKATGEFRGGYVSKTNHAEGYYMRSKRNGKTYFMATNRRCVVCGRPSGASLTCRYHKNERV